MLELQVPIVVKIITFVIFLLLLYASTTDFLKREIKNHCVLLILVCSIGMAFFLGRINFFIPVIVMILGFLLTIVGVIGAGDIKLLAVLLIGMPQANFDIFFFATCCLGSPVSIIALIISKYIIKDHSNNVPFGIAISIGYIVAMSGVF